MATPPRLEDTLITGYRTLASHTRPRRVDVELRALDLGLGALLLVASLPVQALIAVALLLDDGRPLLYRGPRVGRAGRLFTITAWEDTESPQQLLSHTLHKEAIERFFSTDWGTSVMTSVWKPERINALWMRCEACGSLEDYELSGGMCRCGETLPEPPLYW